MKVDPLADLNVDYRTRYGFHDPEDLRIYSWPPQPGAMQYEVARFEELGSPLDCATFTTTSTFFVDPGGPASGVLFNYLVRALAPHSGSWGADSAGVERTNVCP